MWGGGGGRWQGERGAGKGVRGRLGAIRRVSVGTGNVQHVDGWNARHCIWSLVTPPPKNSEPSRAEWESWKRLFGGVVVVTSFVVAAFVCYSIHYAGAN